MLQQSQSNSPNSTILPIKAEDSCISEFFTNNNILLLFQKSVFLPFNFRINVLNKLQFNSFVKEYVVSGCLKSHSNTTQCIVCEQWIQTNQNIIKSALKIIESPSFAKLESFLESEEWHFMENNIIFSIDLNTNEALQLRSILVFAIC